MKNTKIVSLIVFAMTIVAVMLITCSEKSYATDITPDSNQYMELRVNSIEPVEGAGTQVILDLWSYNLDFKGLDVRFSYDNTKLNPSNITTNELTTEMDCFSFVNRF